jgi:hypothetical protein
MNHGRKPRIRKAELARSEAGMTTAEYAVGTVSACGFGGLLYQLLTSGFGQSLLQGIFDNITGLLPF